MNDCLIGCGWYNLDDEISLYYLSQQNELDPEGLACSAETTHRIRQ